MNYKWTLKDAVFTKDKGKVFSCFACGGGSTMGYKLSGFDVLGCNEIDPKMMGAYKTNHNPKYAYLEPIQTFKLRDDLPQELYDLDILDGSPPCSSFSMAGNREKDWGKEKVFREGQAEQVLDTLFFDFIDLAEKLQPKVVIAENVKGLLLGGAIEYVRKIYEAFDNAGYIVHHWLLDASKMGVPQRRERVFFVALRKDLAGQFLENVDLYTSVPKLTLDFNEPEIIFDLVADEKGEPLSELYQSRWDKRIETDDCFADITERIEGDRKCFSDKLVQYGKVAPTITAGGAYFVNHKTGLQLSNECLCQIGSYPIDYIFTPNKAKYLIGMSVPPLMTAKIAEQVYNQWLSKL
jgi:DNA (cytosine-5)-methyltransferase 1